MCSRKMSKQVMEVIVMSCAISILWSTTIFANSALGVKRLLRLHSPEELRANPALLEEHPFGVVTGTVRDAATSKPIPSAIVILVTRSLMEEKGEDELLSVAGYDGNNYMCQAFTDGRGEFAFYYIPEVHLSKEFVLIIRPFGYDPMTINGVLAAKDKATMISAQVNKRQ